KGISALTKAQFEGEGEMRATGKWTAVVFLLLTLMVAPPLAAQINRAEIEGTVFDPQGAVVPGVDVAVTNADTNVVNRATTNSAGYYRVVDLVPGKYTARFFMQGFSIVEVRDIEAGAGRLTRVDGQLRIDPTRQTVEVQAAAPLIEEGSANFSTTVEQKSIQ